MNCTGHLGAADRHSAAVSPCANGQQPFQIGCGAARIGGGNSAASDKMQHSHHMPSNLMGAAPHHGGAHMAGNHHLLRGDDGSSGYGSPDSETFEAPAHQ